MQSPPVPRYLVPPRSKYPPRQLRTRNGVPIPAIKINTGSEGKAPLIFNLGIRWKCVRPMPFSALPTAKEPAVPTDRRLSIYTSHGTVQLQSLQRLAYSLSIAGV